MKEVETVEFWRRRVFETIGTGKDLHHIIWDIDYAIWCSCQEHTASIIKEVIPPHSSILDVGCGYGALYECLQRTDTMAPEGLVYTGLDISPDLLELAKYRHPTQKFVLGDARSMPFHDDEFDWVICRQMSRMIIDNTGMWEEIERELKRVGRQVLSIEYDGPMEWKILK